MQPITDRETVEEFGNLSAARGLSAAIVLCAHLVQIFLLPVIGLGGAIHKLSSFASQYAVVVFFVLSGFLITNSIETNIQRNGRFALRRYFFSRMARIYPPFLAALAVSGMVYMAMKVFGLPGVAMSLTNPAELYGVRDTVNFPLQELTLALLLVTGLFQINGPLWSLYIEVKLYCLIACLYCWRDRRVLLFAPAFLLILYVAYKYNDQFYRHAATWVVGCWFYFVLNRDTKGRKQKIRITSGILALLITASLWPVVRQQGWSFSLVDNTVVTDVTVALIVSYALFVKRISLVAGGRMADYSYTLYVIHFPILLLFLALFLAGDSRSEWMRMLAAFAAGAVALVFSRALGVIEMQKNRIAAVLLRCSDQGMAILRQNTAVNSGNKGT